MAIQIHVGCGSDIKTGWVNVDLYWSPTAPKFLPPDTYMFCQDIRTGLPTLGQKVSKIYHSHVIEHLTIPEAEAFLKNCYEVLEPGGVLRSCVPNFRGLYQAYLENNWEYVNTPDMMFFAPNKLWGEILNYGNYQNGEHVSFWDRGFLNHHLRKAGFSDIRNVEFDSAIDSEGRRRYSFYSEAIR